MNTALEDLATKGLVYGLGASFNGLVGFILIPFFTHRLSAAEYGRYAIAEMVLSLLLVVLGLGMNVAILAKYPSIAPQDRDRFFGSVLSFMLLTTAVFEGLFLLLMQVGGKIAIPVLDMRMVALVAAISALESIWLVFGTLYRAEGWAWPYIGASALQAGAGLVATVWLISRAGYRDDGILVGRLMGDGVLFTLVLLPQCRRYPFTVGFAPARQLLKIGLPLVPATLSTMWVVTSPRYFLQWYGGAADVGIFAMSSKIASVVQLLYIQPFAMAWMVSLFTIYKREDARRVYGRVLTYYLLPGVTLALTVGLLARVVVPILAHQSFPLSATIVLIVALAWVASGLMYPLNIGPYVLERTSKVTPIFVSSAVFITILGITFVRPWGALGAAFALLLVYLVQAVLLARLSQSLYPVSFEAVRVAKMLCALGAAFLLTRWIEHVSSHSITSWALAPLFLALAVGALVALRFFDPAELSRLRAVAARIAGDA